MAFRVKDDFQAGRPMSQVPTAWFNAVGHFINWIVGGFGITTKKSDSGKLEISLNRETLRAEIDNAVESLRISKEDGTPADHTDDNADDDLDGNTWTWTAGGTNGLEMDVYCRTDEDQGWHYLSRARLTISKGGLIIKVEGLEGRREIEA